MNAAVDISLVKRAKNSLDVSRQPIHPDQEPRIMTTRRTTYRSKAGKKLYAVRDTKGKFRDIQTYQRAHAADMRRTSKAEMATKKAKTKSKKK